MSQPAWHRHRRALFFGCVLSAVAAAAACGGPEGGLHVIVDGTLAPGLHMDRLVVRVYRPGEALPLREEVFEGEGLRPLPVTLNLLSGRRTPAGTRIAVSAVATRSGKLIRTVEGEATLAAGEGQTLRLDLGGPDVEGQTDGGTDSGMNVDVDAGPDAGFQDAGGADGGATDGGGDEPDAGDPDGGSEDGGSQDAGPSADAGEADAGVPFDAGFPIPGHIEVEDFLPGGQGVGYFDTTPGNTGGGCRNEDVDMKANTPEADGGCTIGWFEVGEWLAYDVNVLLGGDYVLHARVSRGATGSSSFHILMDGVDVSGPVVVSSTGNWDTFTTISHTGLQLPPGPRAMKLVNDGGVLDLNWVRFELQVE